MKKLVSSSLAILSLCCALTARADLIGDNVSFQNMFFGSPIASGSAVVGSGVEYTQGIAGGNFNIDVGASSIDFFVSDGSSSVGFGGGPFDQSFVVSGLDFGSGIIISGVTVNSVSVVGLMGSPVSFTNDSVTLFVGSSGWFYNTGRVTVDIQTTSVPDSGATAALAGLAILGLAAIHRRRLAA